MSITKYPPQNANEVFTKLQQVQQLAYAPYSKFKVAAAVLANDNKYYYGCNVENAAYPLGCCAENSAISNMILNGANTIKEVFVLGNGESLCTPCGGCRQKIREFANSNCLIHIFNQQGYVQSFTLLELLPESFGPNNLTNS